MGSILRKSLTAMIAGAALMASCLVSAVPASAKTVNRTQTLEIAYDKNGDWYTGIVNYATNQSTNGNWHIYDTALHTNSNKTQQVRWTFYCGTTLVSMATSEPFTGVFVGRMNEPHYCAYNFSAKFETTTGAHRVEALKY